MMKRNKITAVFLSIVMTMSMLMPSIEVMADETSAPSETQKTETAETSEPKSTEKQTPKATDKPAAKGTEKPEPKETSKQEPEEIKKPESKESEKPESKETEKPAPNETENTEPQETQKQVTEETNQPEPEETEKQDPTYTEKQEPEVTKETQETTDDNSNEEVIPAETLPPETASRSRKNGTVASGTCGDQGDNITWSVDDDGTLTITGEGKMVMWNSASSVPWYDNRSIIKKVIISKGITYIGRNSFNGYSNLTSVVIPDTVTQMGGYVFKGCIKLSEISIPNSMISIGQGVFSGCISLTSVTIPDSVTDLQASAFNGCTEITSVTLPKNLTTISSSLFSGCTKLTSIAIPESVTSIGSSAFSKCTGLTNVVIPNSVTTIQASAFSGCTGITSVTLPKNLTTINSSLFSGCSKLTSITIPDTVTTIGSSAFSNCTSLTSLTLPKNIMTISNSVFSGCTKLTSINIPDNVASIGKSAFSGCTGITSIVIPKGVISIGSSAFYNCSGITEISIPDGVYSIEASCFYNCSSLKSITIPASVTTIGQSAFSGCSKLTDIYFNGTESEWNNISISSNNSVVQNNTVQCGYYSIIIGEVNNGTVIVSKSKACAGDEITVTATPNKGYLISNVLCNGNIINGSSFIMPAEDVTIEAIFKVSPYGQTEYTITVSETSNGSASVSKDSTWAGDIITVTVNPDDGYELDTINVNGKAITGNTFTMDAENTTVTVTFKKTEYTVTVVETTNGTVTVNKTKAYINDEITITATPAEGYQLDTIKVNGNAISGNKFTIGTENATVTVTFKELTGYTVTVSETTNGSASVSKDSALEGEEITVTVNPDIGYELDTIKVNGNAISGNKFTMGTKNAEVTVTFKKTEYTITVDETTNGTVTVDKTKAYILDEITITATPAAGYELDTIKVNGRTLSGNTFTMGAKNATVTVTFKTIEYTVTVDNTDNGTVTVNKTKAYTGDEITITATPATGYELDSIKVNSNEISGNKFTIGTDNATVTVTFKKTVFTITVNQTYDGTVTVNNTTACMGDEIIITATPNKWYEVDKIWVYGKLINDNKFTMLARNATVTVTFKRIEYKINAIISEGILTWNKIDEANYYSIDISDNNDCCVSENTSNNSCNINRLINRGIKEEEIEKCGTYKIWITAYFSEYDEENDEYTYEYIADIELSYDYDSPAEPVVIGKVSGVNFSNGKISWDNYPNAVKYELLLIEDRGESIAEQYLTTTEFEVYKWIDSLIETREIWKDEKFSYGIYAYDEDDVIIAEWYGDHAYTSKATPQKIPSIANAEISGDNLTWQEFAGADHYYIRVVTLSGNYLWSFPDSCTFNLKKGIAELVDEWGLEDSIAYKIELFAMSKNDEYLAEWIGMYPGKLANTLVISGKTAKVKYKKVRKKSQKLSISSVVTFKDKGQGKLTYKKLSGNKKITINASTGQVTIKKKLKKGTYKIKVRITASGNEMYETTNRTVIFKVKVK